MWKPSIDECKIHFSTRNSKTNKTNTEKTREKHTVIRKRKTERKWERRKKQWSCSLLLYVCNTVQNSLYQKHWDIKYFSSFRIKVYDFFFFFFINYSALFGLQKKKTIIGRAFNWVIFQLEKKRKVKHPTAKRKSKVNKKNLAIMRKHRKRCLS